MSVSTGEESGPMCFSCGSLFKSDAPECRKFDRFNVSQRKRCKKDEACLYYTWKLSDTKRGQCTKQLISLPTENVIYV